MKLPTTTNEIILKRKKKDGVKLYHNKSQDLTTLYRIHRREKSIEQHNRNVLNKIQNMGNYRTNVPESSTNKSYGKKKGGREV